MNLRHNHFDVHECAHRFRVITRALSRRGPAVRMIRLRLSQLEHF